MFTFPFISRRSHTDIVAVKDEQIQMLKDHIVAVNELAQQERDRRDELSDKLVEAIRSRIPTDQRQRQRQSTEPLPTGPPIDLAMIDPNDNEALALIARGEMSPGAGNKISASLLMEKIARVKEQVLEAHARREAQNATPIYVPASVASRIEEAERAGAQAARPGA